MIKSLQFSVLAIILAVSPSQVRAHEGHAHASAPGEQAGTALATSITLTETTIHNLGITTQAAQLAEIAPMLKLSAVVDAMPERYARLSSRFTAHVVQVNAQPGQAVQKGQILAMLEPLVLGSAPVALKAPINGQLTGSVPAIGQVVSTTDTLFEIADLSEVLVQGQAYETGALSALKTGQSVTITSPSYPGEIFTGTLERIDPSLNPELRALMVYARVGNSNSKLLRHMQVDMAIQTEASAPAVIIPAQAVLGHDGNAFVFVQSGSSFERRTVSLGLLSGNNREIISGVLPDEQVVTLGHYQLQYASPANAAAKD